MATEVRDTDDFHEGVLFAIEMLASVLGVSSDGFSWDTASETMEGDVRSLIGNVLNAKRAANASVGDDR